MIPFEEPTEKSYQPSMEAKRYAHEINQELGEDIVTPKKVSTVPYNTHIVLTTNRYKIRIVRESPEYSYKLMLFDRMGNPDLIRNVRRKDFNALKPFIVRWLRTL